MLKGIPAILSPELFKMMMDMGHGDELVLGDGNFPSFTCARRLIRCDGHNITEILNAILLFLPLDYSVEHPITLMKVTQGCETPIIWEKYKDIVGKYDVRATNFEYISRFDFYERSSNACCVVATGERTRFANIILKKGVVVD